MNFQNIIPVIVPVQQKNCIKNSGEVLLLFSAQGTIEFLSLKANLFMESKVGGCHGVRVMMYCHSPCIVTPTLIVTQQVRNLDVAESERVRNSVGRLHFTKSRNSTYGHWSIASSKSLGGRSCDAGGLNSYLLLSVL